MGSIGAAPVRQLFNLIKRSAADRLASTLPTENVGKLRPVFRTKDVESAHAAYRKAQESMLGTLRAQPFDVSTLHSPMTEVRAARQSLDAALQDMIATAAIEMSPAGRSTFAECTPPVHNLGGATY